MTQLHLTIHPVCALLMPRKGNITHTQQPIVCSLLTARRSQTRSLVGSGMSAVTVIE